MTDLDLNALGLLGFVMAGIGLVAGAEELTRRWSGGISIRKQLLRTTRRLWRQ